MKISKLFHWLYAILMLLPVFFIGSRCFYVILNKNAKDSYYGETINQSELVNPTKLELNKTYTTYIASDIDLTSGTTYYSNQIRFNELLFCSNTAVDTIKETAIFMDFYVAANNRNIRVAYDNNGTIDYKYLTYYASNSATPITFEYSVLQETATTENFLSVTTYVVYNEYSYLDNAFEYSINSLNEVQLFSWAQTSFLSAPMVYITGLFGMPSNSPVITLLSYWLSISIVWLVFDLVMYIPLLVHRWIDRGIIE